MFKYKLMSDVIWCFITHMPSFQPGNPPVGAKILTDRCKRCYLLHLKEQTGNELFL